MKPAFRNTLLVAVAFAALVAGYTTSQWWFQPEAENDATMLVDFSLPDLDGKERWLSEWQGKIIVLNFWATWCGPCREEIPLLIKSQQRYQDQGVRVIGVAIDDRASVAAYAKEMRIKYPLLVGDTAGLAILTRYGNPRGVLPYTVIIGVDGTIVARKLGAYQGNDLQEVLESLVKVRSASILSN